MRFRQPLLVSIWMAVTPVLSLAATFNPATLTASLKQANGINALLAEIASAARSNPQDALAIAETALKVYPGNIAVITEILRNNPAATESLLLWAKNKALISSQNNPNFNEIDLVVKEVASANPAQALAIAKAAARCFPEAASTITGVAVRANQSMALDIAKAMAEINPKQIRQIAAKAVRNATVNISQPSPGSSPKPEQPKSNSNQNNQLAADITQALVKINPEDAVGVYRTVVKTSPYVAQGVLNGASSVLSSVESRMLAALAGNDEKAIRKITAEAIAHNPTQAATIAASLAAMVKSEFGFRSPNDSLSLLKMIMQAAVIAEPGAAPEIASQVIAKVGFEFAPALTAVAVANSPDNGAAILSSVMDTVKNDRGRNARNLHDVAAAAIAVSSPGKVGEILEAALQKAPDAIAGELTHRAIITANRTNETTERSGLVINIARTALKTKPAMSIEITAAVLRAGRRTVDSNNVMAIVDEEIPDRAVEIRKKAPSVAYYAPEDVQPSSWLEDRFMLGSEASQPISSKSANTKDFRPSAWLEDPLMTKNHTNLLSPGGGGGGGGAMGAYRAK
ncbi:MAG TPA: hypothetical protein VFW42_06405 [Fluviicoccus sp.]|nr:hypothetical protein [Fluviicoccus sp.]